MGGGASQERKEYAWCADERKNSPLLIAVEMDAHKPGVQQLGTMSVAHKVSEVNLTPTVLVCI
jgi:hypothetical protein